METEVIEINGDIKYLSIPGWKEQIKVFVHPKITKEKFENPDWTVTEFNTGIAIANDLPGPRKALTMAKERLIKVGEKLYYETVDYYTKQHGVLNL
jgi:hypothetical protein